MTTTAHDAALRRRQHRQNATVAKWRKPVLSMSIFREAAMIPEPRQWKHCEYCGSEMVIDGSCENCEIMNDDRLILDEDMSPEEAFHDTRREDWEREQYRRMDEEDRAEVDDDTPRFGVDKS